MTTCLIDTNILISAALYPNSAPAQAFFKAVTAPYRAVVCDYSMDELRRVFNRKFPHKLDSLNRFLSLLLLSTDIIDTPPSSEAWDEEKNLRDENDKPILRAALTHKIDILLTGDKDFLEADIQLLLVLTATQFMQSNF